MISTTTLEDVQHDFFKDCNFQAWKKGRVIQRAFYILD